MEGLLSPEILQGLLYNYANQNVDQSGFPIDVKRPIVFDQGGNEPHTELSATYTAKELGLPGKGFYNVPTIYNGQIYDADKDFDAIKQNVQSLYKEGFKFPTFGDQKTAIENAISRSKDIGNLRDAELQDAINKRKQNFLMGLL